MRSALLAVVLFASFPLSLACDSGGEDAPPGGPGSGLPDDGPGAAGPGPTPEDPQRRLLLERLHALVAARTGHLELRRARLEERVQAGLATDGERLAFEAYGNQLEDALRVDSELRAMLVLAPTAPVLADTGLLLDALGAKEKWPARAGLEASRLFLMAYRPASAEAAREVLRQTGPSLDAGAAPLFEVLALVEAGTEPGNVPLLQAQLAFNVTREKRLWMHAALLALSRELSAEQTAWVLAQVALAEGGDMTAKRELLLFARPG